MADGLRVDVRGLDPIVARFRDLPRDARAELREGSRRLARVLAVEARTAGRQESRQAAAAARTVKALAGSTPQVTAGPHPLLFGSEFGAKGRFGWYSHPRYLSSTPRQFKPHLGSGSYWFLDTVNSRRPAVVAEYRAMADAIAGRFEGA